MTSTEDEIRRFFAEYDLKGKIMPRSMLPSYLQKIQHYILSTHSHLDGDMLVRILSQIRFEAGDKLTNKVWKRINPLIQDALAEVPYTSKISIIEVYEDVSKDLIRAITKVNTYRNEFAHKRPDILIQKYAVRIPAGKIKLRDLARALKKADDLFLDHTEASEACKYYIRKQMEISDES